MDRLRKKSSGVASDLHRGANWSPLMDNGYRPVSMFAVDDTWTAIRFRPVSESKPLMATSTRTRDDRPVLVVPSDLTPLLDANPNARAIFDKLSYTHRKEFIRWIEEAKRPETRANRLTKTITMLLEKRNLS